MLYGRVFNSFQELHNAYTRREKDRDKGSECGEDTSKEEHEDLSPDEEYSKLKIGQGHTVRIPNNMIDQLRKIGKNK